MERLLVNPLSLVEQCAATEQVEVFLANIAACFDYVLPALDCGRTALFYDPLLEVRSLVPGESVIESISRLGGKRGADLRRKWFLYTKNRSRKLPAEHCRVSLTSKDVDMVQAISGELHNSVLTDDFALLSFGGHAVLQSGTIAICSPSAASVDRKNAWHAASVALLFPQYDASAKHRAEPYFDKDRGEHVAPMQLNSSEAQSLLLQSVGFGGDFWGFYAPLRRFYRFKLTGGNVYHGFEVGEHEVPLKVALQIRDQ